MKTNISCAKNIYLWTQLLFLEPVAIQWTKGFSIPMPNWLIYLPYILSEGKSPILKENHAPSTLSIGFWKTVSMINAQWLAESNTATQCRSAYTFDRVEYNHNNIWFAALTKCGHFHELHRVEADGYMTLEHRFSYDHRR